jgi:parallel beta-helix repeat protein
VLSRRWAKYVALLLLIGMLIPTGLAVSGRGAPSGPSAEDVARQQGKADRQRCVGYAKSVAAELQSYVSRFDAAGGDPGSTPPGIPGIPRLREQVTELTGRVGGNGCDAAVFRKALAGELGDVRASSDLGRAVAGTLVANVRDVLEPGAPRRVEVAAGEDLATAFDGVPSGSTLVLAAGTYRVSRPLVVLQDLTLRGAGQGRTRIVSTAGDAALLQAAPVRLDLSGLSLEHAGRSAASVLLLRAGTTSLDRVVVSGARLASSDRAKAGTVPDLSAGGNGVVAVSRGRLTVRDSNLVDNDAGGLVASARSRPDVSGSTLADNRLCGVCFLGRSAGELRDSTLRSNGVGVIVGNRARPHVSDNTVARNRRAGLVSQEAAAPEVVGNRFISNGDIGVAVYNRSEALVRGNEVTGHRQVGIVVSTESAASPRVVSNRLNGNTRAGLAFLGVSRGTARGNRCSGGSVGLVLGGTSRPDTSGGSCVVTDERTG